VLGILNVEEYNPIGMFNVTVELFLIAWYGFPRLSTTVPTMLTSVFVILHWEDEFPLSPISNLFSDASHKNAAALFVLMLFPNTSPIFPLELDGDKAISPV
jgi:hypothetical protein